MKIKLLTQTAKVPERQTEFSAGYDLFADEDITLYPNEWRAISTGICVNIPRQLFGAIYPRSGLATKHGVVLKNSTGIIDADYFHEVKVCLLNNSEDKFKVERGMRIAQMVLQPFFVADIVVVDELEVRSSRNGGFGSSGTK